jgi:hypothetical protein
MPGRLSISERTKNVKDLLKALREILGVIIRRLPK